MFVMRGPALNAFAQSVEGLSDSGQDLNSGSTATSLPANSNSIAASQIQGTRQPQEPSSTIVYPTSIWNLVPTAPGFLAVAAKPAQGIDAVRDPETKVLATRSLSNNSIPASSTRTSVGTQDEGDDETDHQNTHAQSMPPILKHHKVPSMTLEPSITMDILNVSAFSSENVHTNGASTPIPSLPTDTHLSLVFDAQSATANSKSHYISPSSQALSLGSTSTLGSGTPTSVSAPPNIAATVVFAHSAPALITNAQTVTANSLGHSLLDNQTLTRGGMIKVSGTKISLALNASDVIVGTRTEALRPSFTAGIGSGANGTEVQKFSGDALGVKDGLWGSSLMLLVSVFVLLWL